MNEWLNYPLDEFAKIPWDKLPIGCHIKGGRLLCANIQPGDELFKAIDFTVPVQSLAVGKDLESIVLGLIYLLVLCYVYLAEET